MWFSLEARVPFLDHNLVEMVLSLPPQMLINKGTTKYILREAMKNKLPEPIRLRKDKIGFSTPEDEWFRSPEFVKYVKDLVSCDNFKLRGYFDYKKCLALFEKHIDKKINISKEIWKWINLELWFREFID
jgi:asparagine synthase (glutamine-hydrolysing)